MKRYIERIELRHDWQPHRIFLDDGSELIGFKHAEFSNPLFVAPSVKIRSEIKEIDVSKIDGVT